MKDYIIHITKTTVLCMRTGSAQLITLTDTNDHWNLENVFFISSFSYHPIFLLPLEQTYQKSCL